MAKWKKGQSGNPKGRKKGAQTQSSRLREQLESSSNQIISKVIELAIGGDIQALKLCLERICPPLRPMTEAREIDLSITNNLTAKGEHIFELISQGAIDLNEASQIMGMLIRQAKLIETTELINKVEELENVMQSSGYASTQSVIAPEADYEIVEE